MDQDGSTFVLSDFAGRKVLAWFYPRTGRPVSGLAARCGHFCDGDVATIGSMDVGIRDLRDNLSRYIDRVRGGDELVITDRGSAVARLVPVEGGRKLDRLIAEGVVTPAAKRRRIRPARRVRARGTVSDLVAEQRR